MQRFTQLPSNWESKSVELPSKYLSDGVSLHHWHDEVVVAYERDGVKVRTVLRRWLKLCTFEQLYRAFIVTFLHELVSEKNKHLHLGRHQQFISTAEVGHDSWAYLDSVETQLVIYGIDEVVDAPYRIIPLPGLKQDNALNEPIA
jgi:hypothetical protein